jgi:hypothetical protein
VNKSWPMWSAYEDSVENSSWAESTKERSRSYLRKYRTYCGSQKPSLFMAAEFLNKTAGNGRMTKSAYQHLRMMLGVIMREDGHFVHLGHSYIRNTSTPTPQEVFTALNASKSIAGIQATITLVLFSNELSMTCLRARLRDYNVETRMYLGKHVIPEPFSYILEDQRERLIRAGGNESSFFCPSYNRVGRNLDTFRHRSEKSFYMASRRLSAVSKVDLHWMCKAPYSTRMRPRGSIIHYYTRG